MKMLKRQSRFINRELSWLSFNERVLQEASDIKNPLVQRIRFLGIFSNNLDEFFRVRVAALKRLVKYGKDSSEILGDITPKQVLDKIHSEVIRMQNNFQIIYDSLLKELSEQGIHVIDETHLTKEQGDFVREYFTEEISPLIVPIILSKDGDMPYLRDKAIYFAVKIIKDNQPRKTRYALLEVPVVRNSRFYVLPTNSEYNDTYIIMHDDIIRYNMDDIFFMFEFDKIEAYTLKITRDAELDIDNDISMSFIDKMSKSLKKRKVGETVRFVYDKNMPKDLIRFITRKLNFGEDDNLIAGGKYHNFKDFIKFPFVSSKFEEPQMPSLFHADIDPHKSILEVIKSRDILLHYPYHTFNHFIDFLREAAVDPNVSHIYVTLYRVAERSRVSNALINAAKNGKKVTVLIELLARFDEKANIFWSEKLQESGVRVIPGIKGLKVHSKIVMVKRLEYARVKKYVYIGTGNFNEDTAKLYCDEGFFTSNRLIAGEIAKVFEFLENNYKRFNYRHLLVSPYTMRKQFMLMINNEIKNALAGNVAYVHLKINNLVDPIMINHLYMAGKAGVKIRLIIRGVCSIKVGVEGLSENIEAISIVDKYLEHSRFVIFANGGEERYYITSGDWMTRNFDHRLEVACPIYNNELQADLRIMFDIQWSDNQKSRALDDNQKNEYRRSNIKVPIRAQVDFYNYLNNEIK